MENGELVEVGKLPTAKEKPVETYQGQKISFNTADGRTLPGIVISEEKATPTQVRNRSTGLLVDIIVTRVDVVSLRVSREGNTYLQISSEVVQYGYAPKMLPRFTDVVGLDIDEDGKSLSLQAVIDKVAADREAFINGLYTARHDMVAADAI